MLSKKQKEALKKPCQLCGSELLEVGDLADYEHDIIMCKNDDCRFAMLYNGDILNEDE